MKSEIKDLNAQIVSLESQISQVRELERKNEELQNILKLKEKHMDYNPYNARVTARDPGNFLSVLTIDKGALQTLYKDMPVIAALNSDDGTKYAVVGYISEVGLLSSKVVTFTHSGSSIGVYIERTGETGIVSGEFELGKKGLCKISFLSKETIIETGDKIFSSGGGLYPEDLYIGEVIEVGFDQNSHTMTGYIKPAVDFNTIRNVIVILEFERKFY